MKRKSLGESEGEEDEKKSKKSQVELKRSGHINSSNYTKKQIEKTMRNYGAGLVRMDFNSPELNVRDLKTLFERNILKEGQVIYYGGKEGVLEGDGEHVELDGERIHINEYANHVHQKNGGKVTSNEPFEHFYVLLEERKEILSLGSALVKYGEGMQKKQEGRGEVEQKEKVERSDFESPKKNILDKEGQIIQEDKCVPYCGLCGHYKNMGVCYVCKSVEKAPSFKKASTSFSNKSQEDYEDHLPQTEWFCQVCDKLNFALTPRCVVCSSPSFVEAARRKPERTIFGQDSPSFKMSASLLNSFQNPPNFYSPVSLSQWTCATCFTKNSCDSNACEMCLDQRN